MRISELECQVCLRTSMCSSTAGQICSRDSPLTGGCLSASLTFSLMFQTPRGMSYPGCISLSTMTAALLPSERSISHTASLAA